jgi:hypothetical protein
MEEIVKKVVGLSELQAKKILISLLEERYEQLHQLARELMEEINPDVMLSLDEFMHEVAMTKRQKKQCDNLLKQFIK